MKESSEVHAYAFGALRGAYKRQQGWQAHAAASRHGYMPDEYTYIEDGMVLFNQYDVASATITAAKAIIDEIIKHMNASVMEQVKGHFTYPTNDEGARYVTIGHDVILDEPTNTIGDEVLTRGSVMPSIEHGYAEVENADEMKYRLRIIAERLRPADMATLLSYVDGEYNTLTEACGSKAAYNLFTRRMKVATRGMVLA